MYMYVILTVLSVCVDLTAEVSQMDTKQCYLLATGSATHIVDIHLVIEKKVLCTVDKATHAVAALFASFYIFNTNFPIRTFP